MKEMKQYLLEMGASLMGYAKVNGLYKDCTILPPLTSDSEKEYFDIPRYPFAVSIAVKIPAEVILGIKNQPSIEYYNAYKEINQTLDMLAQNCEKYIVKCGYNAYAQTTKRTKEYGIFNTIMPHKTVAVNAGLGWIGKSALFVTPGFGSAIRLTSVLTDAPLTISDNQFNSPCNGCNICKEACPAGAISGNTWIKGCERDFLLDAVKCRKTARTIAKNAIHKEITLCGKCIEVCPYTRKYLNADLTY